MSLTNSPYLLLLTLSSRTVLTSHRSSYSVNRMHRTTPIEDPYPYIKEEVAKYSVDKFGKYATHLEKPFEGQNWNILKRLCLERQRVQFDEFVTH